MIQPMGIINAKADDKVNDSIKEDKSILSSSEIEQNDVKVVQCSYYVIVDGEEIELKGQLSYSIKENETSNEDVETSGKENGNENSNENAEKDLDIDETEDLRENNTYTVAFNLGYEGGEAIESQKVVAGEYATEPERPDREGYVFIGWYEDGKEYPDMYIPELYPIKKDIILTAQWLEVDTDKDSDGDGVIDSMETLLLMDKDNADTDSDGLDDGVELGLGISPVKSDSDDDGINDGDEDADGDKVSNLKEMQTGTNPALEDSDKDGVTDGEEVNIHKTNPLEVDTDSDGLNDKDEIILGTNPAVEDEYFDVVMESEEEDTVTASVSIKLKGNQVSTLSIERNYNDTIFSEEIPGYLGGAYDFSVDGTFEIATLSFTFNESLVGSEDFEPVIYYYNEEEQDFEPLETVVEGNIASARTTHFSTYILINKRIYDNRFTFFSVWSEGEYKSVEIIFLIDDSSRMLSCDPNNERLDFVKRAIDMLPPNSKIGIGKMDVQGKLITPGTISDKNMAKFYLTENYFVSSGISKFYIPINDGLDSFETTDSDTLRVLVVMADKGSNDGVYKFSIDWKTSDRNIKIHTVGLSDSNDNEADYKTTHMNMALSTGGLFYYAPAGTLSEQNLNIGLNMDLFTDNDKDGIPNAYEENMYLFNGVKIAIEKDDGDTDGDGIIDGLEFRSYQTIFEEHNTRMTVVGKIFSNPTMTDSDGDGLYDNSVRAVVQNGKTIVVAPKDPDSTKVNGPKGMWDAHVKACKIEGIATEYAEYEKEWEETEEYICSLIKIILKQDLYYKYKVIDFALGDGIKDLLDDYIIDSIAEEETDFIMREIRNLRNCEISVYEAKEILKDTLYFRSGLNYASGTFSDMLYIMKKLVDLAEDRGLEVGAYLLTFIPDEKGQAYHAKPETWQKSFGYNRFYDEIFNAATRMYYDVITFNVRGTEYALWLWKGDYWNLKSGAEIGLYYYPTQIGEITHYESVPFVVPMTLGLYNYHNKNDIECLFNWAPTEKQWWITGFNPEFENPNCNVMVVIGSIDFEGKEEMYKKLNDKVFAEKMEKYFIFDEDGHTVWIIWNKKEELLSGKIKHRITGRSNVGGM